MRGVVAASFVLLSLTFIPGATADCADVVMTGDPLTFRVDLDQSPASWISISAGSVRIIAYPSECAPPLPLSVLPQDGPTKPPLLP